MVDEEHLVGVADGAPPVRNLVPMIIVAAARSLAKSCPDVPVAELPEKEIAEELGFSSEYYFNSVFRKHEGYPPGEFRKSVRER